MKSENNSSQQLILDPSLGKTKLMKETDRDKRWTTKEEKEFTHVYGTTKEEKEFTHVYGAANADTDATSDAKACKNLTHLQSKGILYSDSTKLPFLRNHRTLTA